MSTSHKLQLVYDDQCPVCRTYYTNIKINDGSALELIDARIPGKIMDEITNRGLDIDQGMVLKINDKLFYGSEAMHEIAKRSQRFGIWGWVNRTFFSTLKKSNIYYNGGKVFRNILLRLLGIPDIYNLKPVNVLKAQLGDSWNALHPNIQRRFGIEPVRGESILYEGTMLEMRRSFMGWLFAMLTRVIGNPLSPHAGKDIPMEVRLQKKDGQQGVYWQRTYFIPNKKPYVVTSSKQQGKDGSMLECVGCGFGMKLNVFAQDKALHFMSAYYFFTLLGYRIPLPHWISPGQTHVVHKDMGDGDFSFTISMQHPMLGETFYQHGIFRERSKSV